MVILALDDEEPALSLLQRAITAVRPNEELHTFTRPSEALDFARDHHVDVAFLDIRMAGVSGLSIGKRLKQLNPQINLIFTTGYSEYAPEAFQLHSSGYLLKPVTKTDVLEEFENLRYPVARNTNGICAVTFGQFELLVNGEPVHFTRSLAKELLACLIDNHGGSLTRREIAAVLFEDKPYTTSLQSYVSRICYDLNRSLKEVGADQILVHQWNCYSVDTNTFRCDLYDYEAGYPEAIRAFRGEYMKQYSWGEFTLGRLLNPAT